MSRIIEEVGYTGINDALAPKEEFKKVNVEELLTLKEKIIKELDADELITLMNEYLTYYNIEEGYIYRLDEFIPLYTGAYNSTDQIITLLEMLTHDQIYDDDYIYLCDVIYNHARFVKRRDEKVFKNMIAYAFNIRIEDDEYLTKFIKENYEEIEYLFTDELKKDLKSIKEVLK